MLKYFVNPDEHRLRTGWRILTYLAVQVALALTINAIIKHGFGGPPDDKTVSIALRGLITVLSGTLAIWVVRQYIDRKSFISLGLNWNSTAAKDLIAGFLFSAAMIGAIFMALYWLGYLKIDSLGWSDMRFGPLAGMLLWLWGIGIAVGWVEELAFRGYLLQNLEEGLGLRTSVIIMCAFYGVVHMANPNSSLMSGVLISIIGFVRIFGWLRTGQLWLSMGMHAGWNFFQGPVYGFHVSGLGNVNLIQHTVSGPTWITGGVFGPEAGLIVLPVLGLALAAMYMLTRQRCAIPWQRLAKADN